MLPAAPTDWGGAVAVFERFGQALPRLAKVWADSAYRVEALFDWIAAHGRWVLEVVSKRPGQTTFEVQKWRWIVERTFGWFGRYRRLSKDCVLPVGVKNRVRPARPCPPTAASAGGESARDHLPAGR